MRELNRARPSGVAGMTAEAAAGQVTGPDGTLYAHATATCLIFEPRNGNGR